VVIMSEQWTESTITTSMMDDSASEDDGGYVSYNDRPETFIVPVVFGLIFLVGVVGNASLIWILLRNKNMRSVPNTYIFNLAVGDLLVLICSVPFTSTVVSVFTLTALSLDRYSAIVRPVQSYVSGPKSKRMILS